MQGTLTRLDTQSGGVRNRIRIVYLFGVAVLLGSAACFAAENGNNLPWEGPLNTLVT